MLGELDGCPILASETCALDIIGARYVRDIENGEVVVIDEDGVQSHKPFPPMRGAALHLRIHLFRAARIRSSAAAPSTTCASAWARELAREAPVDGRRGRAGAGFRRAGRDRLSRRQSGIPYELGIIRNHYVGRTFIQPTQQIRELGVRLKHRANRAVVERQAHRAGRRLASCAAPPR